MGKLNISDDHRWMNCSLFAPMNTWPLVLGEIRQFIKVAEGQITCFKVQMNYDNGENIRLALLTSSENRQQLYDHLNLIFKSFFRTFPFSGIRQNVDSIFLPYPTAVIEFGLFHLNYDPTFFNAYEVSQQISRFIIEVLEKDDVDFETITTFSFYLQICLLKAILSYYQNDRNFISLLLQPQTKKTISKKVAELSGENMDILVQITTEVMLNEVFEQDQVWISHWINFCGYSLEKNVGQRNGEVNSPPKELINFFQSCVYQINEALGITPEAKDFIEFAVNHSMLVFAKSQQRFFQLE